MTTGRHNKKAPAAAGAFTLLSSPRQSRHLPLEIGAHHNTVGAWLTHQIAHASTGPTLLVQREALVLIGQVVDIESHIPAVIAHTKTRIGHRVGRHQRVEGKHVLSKGPTNVVWIDRSMLMGAVVVYVFGVQWPTFAANIPLNNAIQAHHVATMSDEEVASARTDFEASWNRWNRARTLLAVAVALVLQLLLLWN